MVFSAGSKIVCYKEWPPLEKVAKCMSEAFTLGIGNIKIISLEDGFPLDNIPQD